MRGLSGTISCCSVISSFFLMLYCKDRSQLIRPRGQRESGRVSRGKSQSHRLLRPGTSQTRLLLSPCPEPNTNSGP
jgi:hypothetical protein